MTRIFTHPLAIAAIFAIFVFGGILSWPLLPVELLPSLAYPRLAVRTTFGTAAPEEVETLITRPVESALAAVSGLRGMSSVSTEGLSVIELKFEWGSKMSLVATEVREKLDPITEALPRNVDPPLVTHYNPSDDPIVTLALLGSKDLSDLRVQAETVFKPELETVAGVATVRVTGGLVREIQVLVDAGRVVAQNLDLRDLSNRLETANINFPGGKILQGPLELSLRTVGRFTTIDQIRNLPLLHGAAGGTVRVSDVAEVVDASVEQTSISAFNGKPTVLLSIIKEPLANTVEVSARIRKKVETIRSTLPAGTQLVVTNDHGPFIEEALSDLRRNMVLGSLLALGLLVLGVRTVKGSALIVLSIPVSIIISLGFMALGGVTLNLMSIGGLAVSTGMVVDASIVVLESIYRHKAQRNDVHEAIHAALREVSGSAITATITTVVVLVPILFMTGLAQRLFRDFAFTLASALIVSLLTALILVPAMVVLTERWGSVRPVARVSGLKENYGKSLAWSMNHRGLIIAGTLAAMIVSIFGLTRVGFQLLPDLDSSQLTMRLILPPESSVRRLKEVIRDVEGTLSQTPEIASFVTEAGFDPKADADKAQKNTKSNEANIVVQLKEGVAGGRSRELVVESLRQSLSRLRDVKVEFLLNRSFLAQALGESENPQLLKVVGSDLDTLAQLGDRLVDILKKDPHLKDINCRGNLRTGQIQVVADRYQLASRGLSLEDLAETVRYSIEGKTAGKFIKEDKETDIRVRFRPEDRQNVEQLRMIPMRPSGQKGGFEQPVAPHAAGPQEDRGQTTLLGRVAEVQFSQGLREIMRIDRRRAVTVNGNVVGEAFTKGQDTALHMAYAAGVPEGYEVLPGMESSELMSSLGSLMTAIAIALVLTYGVMTIHFESIRWPLVILLTLPTSIVGPSLALNLTGTPINVLVLIGAIVLIGLSAYNRILMIAYINELRGYGYSKREAIIEACKVRLQPILMTTGTALFGMLPLCLGWGSGSALTVSLALTVEAGLVASLLFTLFLVPVLYDLWGKEA